MNGTRQPQQRVDGVLLLDKPQGITSNDALLRVRRLLNARKAGHGGTLDPMASGLLPIALGEATKFANDSLDADKAYLAEIAMGVVTTTGDAEGEVVSTRPVALDAATLAAALAAFVGEIDQVPPMHSALKRDGRPLYEYARAGITLEREPRRVTIHSLDLLSFGPVPDARAGAPGAWRALVRVACSKGTYVRTLAEDVGERLGCGAHLSGLRRERVGALTVERAHTLERLEAMSAAERAACLEPADFMLAALPALELDEAHARRFLHGQRLRLAPAAGLAARGSTRVRVYRHGCLLGTGSLDDGLLVPQRLVGNPTSEPRHEPAAVSPSESAT